MSCCLVPLIENDLLTAHSVWFMASQFVFISVLCMLFDIKDNDTDYLSGVNTYANRFGITVTKIICCCLLVVGFACFYVFKHDAHSLIISIVLRLLLLGTILFTKEKHHSFYYYLWIDGLLIVQTVLFFIVWFEFFVLHLEIQFRHSTAGLFILRLKKCETKFILVMYFWWDVVTPPSSQKTSNEADCFCSVKHY